jgi:hypothetical protein
MDDAAFAKGFRQISSGIRLKSVPAPRSRSTSQLLSRWSARNLRIKGRVWPQTTVTFEDAGTVEGRKFCGMLCEEFARLPQARDTGLKRGAAHLNRREPASPLARRDRGKACFPVWSAFSAQLRPIDGWSSKTPSELAQPGATNHRNRSNDIVLWGKSVVAQPPGGRKETVSVRPYERFLLRTRVTAPAVPDAPQERPPPRTIEPAVYASPYADEP